MSTRVYSTCICALFINPSTTCVQQNIAKSAKNASKEQERRGKDQGESEKQKQPARAEKPRPPKLNLQVVSLKSNTNNNGNVERASSAPPPPATSSTSMDKHVGPGQPLTSGAAITGQGETLFMHVIRSYQPRPGPLFPHPTLV